MSIKVTPEFQQQLNSHTRDAITYLNSVRPTDGFKVVESSTNASLVLIERRNKALGDETKGYLCIYHDVAGKGNIIGIPMTEFTTISERSNMLKCIKAEALTDENGSVSRGHKQAACRIEIPLDPNNAAVSTSTSSSKSDSSSGLIQSMLGTLLMAAVISLIVEKFSH